MTRRHSEAGITLLEVLVVLAIIGISVGAATLNLEPLESPLQAGTTLLEGFLRQARLNAIATTSAYRVSPTSATELGAETADSCAASTWTTDTTMNLDMPSEVEFDSTSWSVCFSSRGISAGNVVIGLHHDTFGDVDVEVLLGGTTRVVE
jgi:prepilin-type N-terminal cleavage/methylation domain-containing protein